MKWGRIVWERNGNGIGYERNRDWIGRDGMGK